MAQPLSYEDKELVFLITTKTIGSKLWFINNKKLENKILAYLAKYQSTYEVIIYGFVLMGNHYHLLARFPKMNRAKFMRSFNSIFAKLVAEYEPLFDQGKLWARRYSFQAVPRNEDILHWATYLALNPVSSGLCSDSRHYPGYNSFYNSNKNKLKFKVFDRMRFNNKKRFNAALNNEDYMHEYTLRYSRIPGLDDLEDLDYFVRLRNNFELRRSDLIKNHISKDYIYKRSNRKRNQVGKRPVNPKTSTRYSFRPLVLTLCNLTKNAFLERYFNLVTKFKEVSKLFRAGFKDVIFPIGTYPPSLVSLP